MPPVLLKCVSVTLHDLKHDSQTPETPKHTLWISFQSVFFFLQIKEESSKVGDGDPPGPDVQFAAVDDAGKLKQDGEPASHPNAVTRGHVHIVTSVFS